MALRIHLLSTLFSSSSFNAPITTLFTTRFSNTRRLSCTNNNGISDAALASELSARATRINTHKLQAEEAMRKSREILFGELCDYMGLKEDEAQQKWSKMEEDEKWVLVKGFVAEWGEHFHPLSARSIKEMVEEYLRQGKQDPTTTSPTPNSVSFPGLKRMIGFS